MSLSSRALLSLLVLAGLSALLGWQAPHVAHHYEMEDFFPTATPERAAFDRLRESFGPDDRIALLVVESPTVFDSADFRTFAALDARLAACPLLEEVVSPATAPVVVRKGDDEVTLEPAVPLDKLSAARVAQAFEAFAAPPWAGTLMAADRKVATVRCVLLPAASGGADRATLLALLEAEAAALEEATDWTVRLAGYPLQRVMLDRASTAEVVGLYPWVLAAMLFVLAFALRSGFVALFPLLVALLASLWVTGASALLGLPLNHLAPAVYILVVVVGVSDGVHLLARHAELVAGGLAPDAATVRTLRELTGPCLLTSVTTALGFAALQLTGIPLVASFGAQVALGVMAAFCVTLLGFPAFLLLAARLPGGKRGGSRRLERGLGAIEAAVLRRPGRAAAACLTLLAVAAGGLFFIEVNSPLLADLDPEHPIRETNRFLEERLSGVISVDLLVPAAEASSLYGQAHVERVDRLARSLQELDGVRLASSPADLLRQMRPLLPGVPDEDVLGLLPTALLVAEKEVSRWVDFDGERMRIRLLLRDLPTAEALALFAQIGERYAEELGRPMGDAITGQGYLGQIVNLRIVEHFQTSFLVALGAVFLLLLCALRSLKLALLSLLANLFPVVFVAGVMGYAGIDLRYTSALVLSVIFGLAVDDTIHFLSSYRAAGPDRLRNAYRRAGPGILLTSIVLIAGFSVLLASDFVPNRVLGLLLSLTAVSAALADLVLLPALLSFGRKPIPPAATEP